MESDLRGNASILVVEDNPDLNTAVCEILRSYGFRVSSATDGVEALEQLKHLPPDAVLCDIMMPGMDGYTLLKHARADLNLRTLPFIFLTARTSLNDQRRAREIGIEDYLTKPVDSRNLVLAINNALRRRQFMKDEMQQQLDALRNRIIGLLQHEFRTPLTFVLGYAEYLMDATAIEFGPDFNVDELRSSTAAILDGGRRLQRLIESFLMLAELQNRTLASEKLEILNGLTLLHDITSSFQRPLQEANLTPVILAQNDTALIYGDEELLREALRRLIDNAIRYRCARSAHVWLSIELLPTYVGFRIRDEGAGMPLAMIHQFARPFEQFDRDNRTQPGAGLSLALIYHIARLHGGNLKVTSELGVGSTFTLWLPAALESTTVSL
ncbi:MAG: response regulator [Chloroflexota bacterium]|nr:response regulator [Chloroflexota bacterium]